MKKLAKAILRAAQLREESFDAEKAELILKHSNGSCNFSNCYKFSLSDNCYQAAIENKYGIKGAEILYLLLKHSWNESLYWAENYIKAKKENKSESRN